MQHLYASCGLVLPCRLWQCIGHRLLSMDASSPTKSKKGPSTLSPEQRQELLDPLLQCNWKLVDGRDAISKSYKFKDFQQWFNVYNRVDVTLTTHSCGGISSRDVRLASVMDAAAAKYFAHAIRADQLKVSPGPVLRSPVQPQPSPLQTRPRTQALNLAPPAGAELPRSARLRKPAEMSRRLTVCLDAGTDQARARDSQDRCGCAAARLHSSESCRGPLIRLSLLGWLATAVLGGIVVRGAEGDAQPAGDLPVGGAGHAHANQLLTLLSAELWRHLAPADFVEGWRLV
uniref:4a-hydroxytetrahydrobiopterin dehydratase n=1 Tax=Macrostomum lignano TaxID=282301 RepID=A0A1I8F7K6_9PLAT